MNPPQCPLSYGSAKSIFGYFTFTQRKTVSRRCPSTRRWHRTLPFLFDHVAITYGSLEIDNFDNFKWEFQFSHKFNPEDSAEEEANSNCPTKKFVADETIPLTVTIPSGKKFFFDNYDSFNRLLNHYINRKGNKIRHLEIQTVWENTQEFVGVKVRELTMQRPATCKVAIVKENRDKLMNSFKNNEFDKVYIKGNRGYDEIVEQLKDMNIKHLQLDMETFDDLRIQELDFEQIVLRESPCYRHSDGLPLVERIAPFIARSHDKPFVYMLNFINSSDFDPKVIVNLVKERWGAEHKYDNYDGMLAIDINDDWQVQIACYLGQSGHWTDECGVKSVELIATIMEKKTLVPAAELSNYRRILRRMHIWQCSVTESMKKSSQLKDYCKENEWSRECVFFLNNYYLRSITFLLFFGFSSLVFSVFSILGFPLGAPVSFLASLVLSGIANFLFLLPYKYDCREETVWDIAAE